MIIVAHKIMLQPTAAQAAYLLRCCEMHRLAWNWALGEWNRQYDAGGKPHHMALRKQFCALKREQYPFVEEVFANVGNGAFRDLGRAWDNFRKNPGHWDKPTFKKRGRDDRGFYLANIEVRLSHRRAAISTPRGSKLNMSIRMRENPRWDGRLLAARISRRNNRWWLSLQYQVEEPPYKTAGKGSIGVDVGLSKAATLSNGDVIANPRAFQRAQEKMRRLQRSFSRMRKGGANWHKQLAKIDALWRRINGIRGNMQHQLTGALAREYAIIGIEDLNVKGMMRNSHLAKALADVGFAEIRRQLEYKCSWSGAQLYKADQWEPSSKRCSRCGTLKADLTLKDRTYHCEHCGLEIDRDLNAAINLAALAEAQFGPTLEHKGSDACGEESPGRAKRKQRVVKLCLVEAGIHAPVGVSG